MNVEHLAPGAALKPWERREFSVTELAETADRVLTAIGFAAGDDASGMNMRLIRDYTQRGILTRPERSGREARYGYRQLVELVAARVLLSDGWPLAKVALYIQSTPLEQLEALAAPRPPATSAVRAVRDIRARYRSGGSASSPGAAATPPSAPNVVGRQAQFTGLMSELARRMRGIDKAYPEPRANEFASISLADDLHLLIGNARLRAMTLEEAEAIGKAATAALVHLRPKGAKA